MMSAGEEGKKLASEMGGMEQDKFDEAFSALLGSGSYKPQEGEQAYSRDTDEDYGDFDADSDDDYGFDEEDDYTSTIDEMRKDGINMDDPRDVMQYLGANMGLDREDQVRFMERLGYSADDIEKLRNPDDYEEDSDFEFTEAEERQIDKYAEHYGADANAMKKSIYAYAQEYMKGDNMGDEEAYDKAMEEVLDEVANGEYNREMKKAQEQNAAMSEGEDENKTYHFEESGAGEEPDDYTLDGIKYMIDHNLEGEPNRENVDRFLRGAGLNDKNARAEVLDKLGYKNNPAGDGSPKNGSQDYKTRIKNARDRYIEKIDKLPFGSNLDEERKRKAEQIAKEGGWNYPNHYAYLDGITAYEEGEFNDDDLRNYLTEQYGSPKNNPQDENKGNPYDPEKLPDEGMSQEELYGKEMKAAQEQNAAMSEGQNTSNNFKEYTDKNGEKVKEFSSDKDAKKWFDKHQNELPDGAVLYANKVYVGKDNSQPAGEATTKDEWTKRHNDFLERGKSTWNQKLIKGDKVTFEGKDGKDIEGYIGGFWNGGKLTDEDAYEEGKDNNWHDFRGVGIVDKDGKELGSINAYQIKTHGREAKPTTHDIANSARGKEIKNILNGMNYMSKEEKKQFLLSLLDEE